MAKIAIITGSGSGIGRAAALALLKNGYKVVLAGRRKEALEDLVCTQQSQRHGKLHHQQQQEHLA